MYEEYLKEKYAVTFEKMDAIATKLFETAKTDQDMKELYEEFLVKAVEYAHFRAQWNLWSREERLDTDSRRTSCHDSVIVKLNQLARYFRLQGLDTDWRDELGDEKEDPAVRKRIGDFACYVVFMHSLRAR